MALRKCMVSRQQSGRSHQVLDSPAMAIIGYSRRGRQAFSGYYQKLGLLRLNPEQTLLKGLVSTSRATHVSLSLSAKRKNLQSGLPCPVSTVVRTPLVLGGICYVAVYGLEKRMRHWWCREDAEELVFIELK